MQWNTINGSLTSIKKDNEEYKYTYFSDGQRLTKNVNGKKTVYIYNAGMLLAEETDNYRINYYYDANGLVTQIGYLEKNNGTYSDERYYFFTRNGQGDIVGIYRNSDSTLVGTYEYDLWGNIVSVKENVITDTDNKKEVTITDTDDILNKNPLRYRGYYYDAETGFYYLNARYYDPKVHRWLSPEPNHKFGVYDKNAGINAYNLYAYCGNDPINYSDYTGEELVISMAVICACACAVIGMIIGGVLYDIYATNMGYKGWDRISTDLCGITLFGIIGGLIGLEFAPLAVAVTGITGVLISGEGITLIQKIVSNIDSLENKKIRHIIEGSLRRDHHWERMSPNKDWEEIKEILIKALQIGKDRIMQSDPSGTVYERTAEIDGNSVTVRFKIFDGIMHISDGWVN